MYKPLCKPLCKLSCGLEEGMPVTDLDAMIRLAIFADRYEMAEVVAAVKDAIRRSYLTVESCITIGTSRKHI